MRLLRGILYEWSPALGGLACVLSAVTAQRLTASSDRAINSALIEPHRGSSTARYRVCADVGP